MAETTGQPEALAALAHARGESLLADEPRTALRELRSAAEKFAELELPYATAQSQLRAAAVAAQTGNQAAALDLLYQVHDTAGRQIGETLFISPRTAEMHVQGGLRKLGFRSRA